MALHPGAMLVDWHSRVGVHPVRNDLTARERDLITRELMGDPDTRVRAAMAGTPFGVTSWATIQTANAVLAALSGNHFEFPGSPSGRQPTARPSEIESARVRLREHSAIAHLPEE